MRLTIDEWYNNAVIYMYECYGKWLPTAHKRMGIELLTGQQIAGQISLQYKQYLDIVRHATLARIGRLHRFAE